MRCPLLGPTSRRHTILRALVLARTLLHLARPLDRAPLLDCTSPREREQLSFRGPDQPTLAHLVQALHQLLQPTPRLVRLHGESRYLPAFHSFLSVWGRHKASSETRALYLHSLRPHLPIQI